MQVAMVYPFPETLVMVVFCALNGCVPAFVEVHGSVWVTMSILNYYFYHYFLLDTLREVHQPQLWLELVNTWIVPSKLLPNYWRLRNIVLLGWHRIHWTAGHIPYLTVLTFPWWFSCQLASVDIFRWLLWHYLQSTTLQAILLDNNQWYLHLTGWFTIYLL